MRIHIPKLILIWLFFSSSHLWAFQWQDLWVTHNQQASQLMAKGQFTAAKERFEIPAWQATAAYRSGNYEEAAKQYASFKNEQGFYNQGNALAHMGHYPEALKAYDNALKINPHNKDAAYNRKVVDEILKKEQQNTSQKNDDSQKDDHSKQEKDSEVSNQQEKPSQSQQNKTKSERSGEKSPRSQEKQEALNQSSPQKQQEKSSAQKTEQSKNKSEKPAKKDSSAKTEASPKASKSEQQQAKEQWLRLIPDDPGGLLREKFLRDHLRRARGWAS